MGSGARFPLGQARGSSVTKHECLTLKPMWDCPKNLQPHGNHAAILLRAGKFLCSTNSILKELSCNVAQSQPQLPHGASAVPQQQVQAQPRALKCYATPNGFSFPLAVIIP